MCGTLGPLQTSNFSCAEPNARIRYMKRSTYESIKIDLFEFGSTLPFYPTGPVEKNGKSSTAIQTSNFSCAESNAYITYTLDKLFFTHNAASFAYMSCAKSLYSKIMAGREEGSCTSCFNTTKYTCLSCQEYFCSVCSVFENDESVVDWTGGSSVAYCEPCFREKMEREVNTPVNSPVNSDPPSRKRKSISTTVAASKR